MKAVILAGGKGTRLSALTRGIIPKPLVRVGGIPVLEHQIKALSKYKIREFVFVTGFLREQIESYFGGGEKWNVNISYIKEEEPAGTGGSLPLLAGSLDDDFILLYGDLVFDISVSKMLEAHKSRGALVTLFAHPNSHPADSDLLVIDGKNRVTGFSGKKEKRGGFFRNLVNAGILMASPEIFARLPVKKTMDLEKDIVFPLCGGNGAPAGHGEVFAYCSSEYIKDAGTPERLERIELDMKAGIIAQKNLDNPQKCVFLDRDGTLNRYNGLVCHPGQLELERTAAEAVKAINNSPYLAVVVTNQPVVARGLCTIERLEEIHNRLEALLGENGAYLDGIFYCPHHPDGGYEGENPAYKIPCRCRKPGTGLIEESIRRFNIAPGDSFFIGDTTTDIQTGINAGLATILVQTGLAGSDKKHDVTPGHVCKNIGEAVRFILNERR